ncbi:hypothetical protein HDV00_005839 [Rhizophlyctis rosea]|nr:hypothetical protein HDV00_005839 [Rhizophlyctis rosea]
MHQITLIQETGEKYVLADASAKDGVKGDLILGRKVFGVESKRCSREQVKVQFDGNDGTVTVTQEFNLNFYHVGLKLGPNTSVVERKGVSEDMVRNQEYTLQSGDGVYLLKGVGDAPLEHYFKIDIDPPPASQRNIKKSRASDSETDDGEAEPAQPAAKKSSTSAQKRRPSEDDEEDDENEPAQSRKKAKTSAKPTPKPKPKPKKRRAADDDDDDVYGAADSDDYFDPDDPDFVVGDDEEDDDDEEEEGEDDGDALDDRPKCKYGKACYRKNPDHFAEFAHPWLDEEKIPKRGKSKKGGSTKRRGDDEDDEDDGGSLSKRKSSQRGGKRDAGTVSDRVRSAKRKRVDYRESDEDEDEDDYFGDDDPAPKKRVAPAASSSKKSSDAGASSSWIPKRKKSDSDDGEEDKGEKEEKPEPKKPSPKKESPKKTTPPATAGSWIPKRAKPAETESDSEHEDSPTTGQGPESDKKDTTPPANNEPPKASPTSTSSNAGSLGSAGRLERGRSSVGSSRRDRSLTPVLSRGSSSLSKSNSSLSDDASAGKGVVRLAIPSISTDEGKVPLQEAVKCAGPLISGFLKEHESVEVVLVDSQTEVVDAFAKDVLQELKGSPRFRALVGDLSRLKTGSGVACQYVVVEISWRWKPTATAVCKAVYDRAGPTLAESTKAQYTRPATVGEAYPVEVDKSSPLASEEGVLEVIHVVGPNMNPSRPHCLDATDKAIEQLESTYRAALDCFAKEAKLGLGKADPDEKGKGKEKASGGVGNGGQTRSLFDVLMDRSTPPPIEAPPIRSPAKGNYDYDKFKGNSARQFGGGWSDALRPYCENPEKYLGKEVVEFDPDVVVVRDKFGKSRHHYLVLPRRPIDSLTHLKTNDLGLLEQMKRRADLLVSEIQKSIGGRTNIVKGEQEFRIGFHAVPSMRHLHLHVISQDFDSDAFKNKKHWKSFTTGFFKDFGIVRDMLRDEGKVWFDPAQHEALLKGPLKCHRCGRECKNIPEVKKHIAGCNG